MFAIFTRLPEVRARRVHSNGWARLFGLVAVLALGAVGGCTSFSEYVHNGFKVGPNYRKPPAPVADEWIDSRSKGVNPNADLKFWWKSFQDPVLDGLVEQAYRQNLTLRAAGTRILAARARRNIAVGFLFPQTQEVAADYTHSQTSLNNANPAQRTIGGTSVGQRIFDVNRVGVNLAWELDFWGRFRRAVEATNAELDASVENFDDALVILISEIATTYVEIRVIQQQIAYVDSNIAIQTEFVKEAEDRLKGGVGRLLSQGQMRSNLFDTQSIREQLEIQLRQANNQLCVLLGMPVRDLIPELGRGEIPMPPPEAAVGMPAELLRRRPDVRRAERLVAAQSARIGIATADLYPRLSILGTLGYEAENFGDLFSPRSFVGSIGPNLRWDVLNYGRLLNNIRLQDALYQNAVVDYQNLVLQAGREVEDGIVVYLRSQQRTRQLAGSAQEAEIAVREALQLSKDVKFDLNTAFVTSNFLVRQQDKLAQARGDIALGFIRIYRALGGGWELRLPPVEGELLPAVPAVPGVAPAEVVPPPAPVPAIPNGAPANPNGAPGNPEAVPAPGNGSGARGNPAPAPAVAPPPRGDSAVVPRPPSAVRFLAPTTEVPVRTPDLSRASGRK